MAMERIARLHEQASVLQMLAGSFDIQTIRDQLLELAARCDQLADSMEQNPQSAGLTPVASSGPPRSRR